MMWRFPTVSAVGILFIASAAAAGQTSRREPKRPEAKVLAFFASAQWTSLEEFIRNRRPAPPSQELRARVMASLPRDGELRPTAAEQRKLAALDSVLAFHERKDVIAVKVIEVGQTAVALHGRTVLLVSRAALALFTPEELQAVAAHELAHEYSWDDYQAAIKENAWERRQEMELMCDGFAVMTLRVLGVDPGRLTSAVTKLTRYNERVGATATAGAYVSLEDRRRFIESVAGVVEAKERAHAAHQTAADQLLRR
jgi:hypothetical protein